jgi:hypothetical protein
LNEGNMNQSNDNDQYRHQPQDYFACDSGNGYESIRGWHGNSKFRIALKIWCE